MVLTADTFPALCKFAFHFVLLKHVAILTLTDLFLLCCSHALKSTARAICFSPQDIDDRVKSGTPLDLEDQAKLQTPQIWALHPDTHTHTHTQPDSTPFVCTLSFLSSRHRTCLLLEFKTRQLHRYYLTCSHRRDFIVVHRALSGYANIHTVRHCLVDLRLRLRLLISTFRLSRAGQGSTRLDSDPAATWRSGLASRRCPGEHIPRSPLNLRRAIGAPTATMR